MTPELISGIIGAAAAGIVAIIGALFKRNQNRKDQYEHEEKIIELSKGISETNKILNDFRSLSRDLDRTNKGLEELHIQIINLSKNTIQNDLMMLRNSILTIYFTYEKEKEIPEAQYESMLGMFDVYTSLGGNSFVHDIVDEMRTWKRTI